MIGGLQPWHILLIVLIALLIFGPKPLSNLFRSFRKAGDEFRQAAKDEKEKSTTKDDADKSSS